MSAEVLLEAAALMRERATAPSVARGPWEKEFSDVIRTDVPLGAPGYLIAECATIYESSHIASWHPAVALAVADWLEECGTAPGWEHDDLSWLFDDALSIARAYLGSTS